MLTCFRNTRYAQYIAAFAAAMAVTSMTGYAAWSSPVLPQLQSENSPIGEVITVEQGSWIVSVFILAGLPTTPFSALLVESLGRQRLLVLSAFFLFVPWLLIIFATNFWFLFAARFLGGVGTVLSITSVIMYNAEIADPDIRGKISTSYSWMKLLGNFLVLSMGPFVSYTTISAVCSVFPAVLFVLILFMPESPYYLMKTGQKTKARAALRFLAAADTSEEVIEEKLGKIETIIEEDRKRNRITWKGFLMGRQYRRLIFITLLLKSLEQLCGYIAVKSYMQSIIKLTGSSISPEYSSIAFGAIEIPAAVTSSLLIDKVGRKPLLITSSLGCAVALISEGTYFYLQDKTEQDLSHIAWLPTTAIVLYVFFLNIGVSNVTVMMPGEIYPSNIKGVAVSLGTFYGTGLSFLVAKFFAPSSEAWGVFATFWVFAGFCLLGALLVHLVVPETKGRSFDEIQEMINPKTCEKTGGD